MSAGTAARSVRSRYDPDVIRRLDLFQALLRNDLAGEGRIRRDDITLALYSSDASMYQVTPLAVCFPGSSRDVARIVEVASELGLPLLPRGGASSLAGQTVGEAVVLDFTRHMQHVLTIDPDARTATVEPGVVLDNLNRELAGYGLMVGPDPASANRATLGGMVANNATGTHSIVYGNVDRHIVSVEAVLADGSVVTFERHDAQSWHAATSRSGLEGDIYRAVDKLVDSSSDVIARDTPRHWRRNSGYRLETMLDPADRNLARLICGSEGTLAIVTKLTIGLVERPEHTALGIVHFETRDEALRAVTAILATHPSAVELLDGVAIEQCRAMPAFAARMGFVEGNPGAVLITEYAGKTSESALSGLRVLVDRVARENIGYSVVECTDPSAINAVWSVRKEALGLIMGVKGDFKPVAFIEDASVPVEHLASYIRQLDEFIVGTNTPAVYYAHASAGCLHVRPFIDTKRAHEIEKMVAISRRSMQLVRSFGGSVSSEHGDGLARSWLNPDILGAELYGLNQRLKQIFDPAGILNPGKVVDAPPMDRSLRFGSGYSTMRTEDDLDFSADGGFAGSVELCTGMGTCRKTTTGAMCPSFMATNEEKDSTRGRANALRAALSGALPHEALYEDGIADVLDLCIQCKACKTECPAGVDMAAIKTEWLYHYKKRHGTTMRDRIFARMPDIARAVTGRRAHLVNAVNRNVIVRALLDHMLGIDRTRMLPPFAARPFTANERGTSRTDGAPQVVLFADTFNNYNEPHVAAAAYALLTRVGYDVVVPARPLCCGRTRLSKGDVDGARSTIGRALDELYPLAAQGLTIVGLEPSCIYTFGDEGRRLHPDDARMEIVARACVSFERFVADDVHGLFGLATWKPLQSRVLLHGHCHQKALEGTAFAVRALRHAATELQVLDTSCCGMAGSFGYESEHVSTSRRMAERRLAPAVRELPADGAVVAAGSSCRAQIADVTQRHALHPAELLARCLVD